MMDLTILINIVYLLSAVAIILGLRLMRNPAAVKGGNMISGIGMGAALAATFMDPRIERMEYILAGLLAGALGGLRFGRRANTANPLPETALLNGFSGLAAALVAWSEFHAHPAGQGLAGGTMLWLTASLGSVAFSGSAVAWTGLKEKIALPRLITGQRRLMGVVLFGILLTGAFFSMDTVSPEAYRYFAIFTLLSLLLGVLWAISFDKSDMPAAVSALRAFSGFGVCAAGFVVHNTLLVGIGAILGASGIALAFGICKAMNRPAFDVLSGGYGPAAGEV